jgi:hypothetical protein
MQGKSSKIGGFWDPVGNLIKLLKLGQKRMVKRNTYRFRRGSIKEVEEYHDGNYGAPGKERITKKKKTPEQMELINQINKTKRCRHRLLEYFNPDDIFATWTYEVKNRPPDMETALKHFRDAMRKVREKYRKQKVPLYWIKNIEQGTRGAWHIHLVVTGIGDTASILTEAWTHGGTYVTKIRLNDKIYDEDFSRLAAYMTKDEHTREKKKDGTEGKPRLRQASYSTSRNMPLKKPKVDRLIHWKKEVKPPKGYVIIKIHEGKNPVTGYSYRRYTMVRVRKRGEGP